MSISWMGKRDSENCWYEVSFWTPCSSSSFSSGVLKNFTLFFVSKLFLESLNCLNSELVQLQQHNTAHSKKDNSLYKILCKMLDGNLDSSSDISKSKVWFGLYHPKVPHTDFLLNIHCLLSWSVYSLVQCSSIFC